MVLADVRIWILLILQHIQSTTDTAQDAIQYEIIGDARLTDRDGGMNYRGGKTRGTSC
jgi:hypothetical protein